MGARKVAHAKAAVALREDRDRQHQLDYAHIMTAVNITADEYEGVVKELTEALERAIGGCACVGDEWEGMVLALIHGKAALRDG